MRVPWSLALTPKLVGSLNRDEFHEKVQGDLNSLTSLNSSSYNTTFLIRPSMQYSAAVWMRDFELRIGKGRLSTDTWHVPHGLDNWESMDCIVLKEREEWTTEKGYTRANWKEGGNIKILDHAYVTIWTCNPSTFGRANIWREKTYPCFFYIGFGDR